MNRNLELESSLRYRSASSSRTERAAVAPESVTECVQRSLFYQLDAPVGLVRAGRDGC